ncbi:hypothetical protein D3C75_1072360 [compost metagenome]
MAATDNRIDRDAFTEPQWADIAAYLINHAKKLVADHSWIAGERVMPMVNMHIRTTDTGKFNLYPHFVGRRLRQGALLDSQQAGLFNDHALHGAFSCLPVP